MKRTKPLPIDPGLFQLNVFADQRDEIRFIADLAHDLVGYQRHSILVQNLALPPLSLSCAASTFAIAIAGFR